MTRRGLELRTNEITPQRTTGDDSWRPSGAAALAPEEKSQLEEDFKRRPADDEQTSELGRAIGVWLHSLGQLLLALARLLLGRLSNSMEAAAAGLPSSSSSPPLKRRDCDGISNAIDANESQSSAGSVNERCRPQAGLASGLAAAAAAAAGAALGMGKTVVAGFEEQEEANELSSSLIEEALEAIRQLQQVRSMSQHLEEAQVGQQLEASPPPFELEEANSHQALESETEEEDDDDDEEQEEEQEEELNQGDDEDEELEKDHEEQPISCQSNFDDFCGRQASEMNLRQLRMSALQDVLVCGQSRHSTESARRLFSMLSSRNQPASGQLKSHSLSSRSSAFEGDDDDGELDETAEDKELLGLYQNKSHSNVRGGSFLDDIYSRPEGDPSDDYGTIKIVRRKCYASSSSCSDLTEENNNNRSSSQNSNNSRQHYPNFGRTLVCSLSPVNGTLALEVDKTSCSSRGGGGGGGGGGPNDDDDLSCYPIDGDEIRQCRAAFRENRRLIEEAQTLAAVKRMEEHTNEAAPRDEQLRRSCSQVTMRSDRSHWADSLSRRQRLPECSRCHEKLYPVDRMELDFTRAKLNIHRNCFKCQVCSTLLRLETYASLDTKLFCPAHTRRAVPLSAR